MFLFLFLTLAAQAQMPAAREEALYREYYNDFFHHPAFVHPPAKAEERKLALDAVEDALLKGAPSIKLLNWFSPAEVNAFTASDQLRLFRLKASRQLANRNEELLAVNRAKAARPAPVLRYEIDKARKFFATDAGKELAAGQKIEALVYAPPSVQEVKNLFSQPADLAGFQNGAYAGKPRLFLFCRHRREYACLMAFRDKNDQPLREGGKLWTQPAIAMSDGNVPYDQRNGNTPMGVHLVKGVMPSADQPLYFGKFRRLVLDFVPASTGEQEQKKLFPESSRASNWWKEAVVARDIGRNLLRMHGTGSMNPDPSTSFYPFLPTIGCVGQREGKYGSQNYTDQRSLLDRWMKASGIDAVYENEPKIQGLLYVIDIDNAAKPVTVADLKALGIE